MACMFHRLRGYLLLMQVFPLERLELMIVDVSVTIDIFGQNKVFQEKTASWACYVLGWDFYGSEPFEFAVFDVLVELWS
jgi:hypothetical protein